MIKKPLVSEKSMNLTSSGFYTFLVDKNTTKENVKKQTEDRFKVDVLEVRIVNIPGKIKLQRTKKGYFETKGKKKAIVKIKKGQKIPLFENLGEDAQKDDVVVKTGEGEEVATVKEKRSLLRRTKVKISRLSPAEIEKSPSAKASGDKGEK